MSRCNYYFRLLSPFLFSLVLLWVLDGFKMTEGSYSSRFLTLLIVIPAMLDACCSFSFDYQFVGRAVRNAPRPDAGGYASPWEEPWKIFMDFYEHMKLRNAERGTVPVAPVSTKPSFQDRVVAVVVYGLYLINVSMSLPAIALLREVDWRIRPSN